MAYTAKQVIEAITKAQGMPARAAQLLGCSPSTVYRHIQKSPSVREAFEDARHHIADRIEGTLLNQALGRRDPDSGGWAQVPNITALIFLAKTHPAMRERGYGEKRYNEHAGADGGAIRLEWVDPVTGNDDIGIGADDLPSTA